MLKSLLNISVLAPDIYDSYRKRMVPPLRMKMMGDVELMLITRLRLR